VVYSTDDEHIGMEQLVVGREHLNGPLELKRIDGAGHFIARNAPEQFNQAVLQFLERYAT